MVFGLLGYTFGWLVWILIFYVWDCCRLLSLDPGRAAPSGGGTTLGFGASGPQPFGLGVPRKCKLYRSGANRLWSSLEVAVGNLVIMDAARRKGSPPANERRWWSTRRLSEAKRRGRTIPRVWKKPCGTGQCAKVCNEALEWRKGLGAICNETRFEHVEERVVVDWRMRGRMETK